MPPHSPPRPCCSLHQRCRAAHRSARHAPAQGHALLEALVGLVLLGIVGLGIAMVAARTVQSQSVATAQASVVQHMRHRMQQQGIANLCHTPQISLSGIGNLPQVPVSVACQPITAQVHLPQHAGFSATQLVLPPSVQNIAMHTAQGDAQLQQLFGHTAISVRP